MPDFRTRSHALEIMDDLSCSGEVVHQTLRELDFINQWLGGNAVTLSGINQLLNQQRALPDKLHLADMGCGSGDLLRILHAKYSRLIPGIQLEGIDANKHITSFARQHLREFSNISIQTENIFDPKARNRSYDIITATLFLHHFSDNELSDILCSWKQQARIGIVINDLHRHPLAYHSIRYLTRWFSNSSMVKYDAPLSVLRGFSEEEWRSILNKAGITNYRLVWRWAFRWQLIIPTAL